MVKKMTDNVKFTIEKVTVSEKARKLKGEWKFEQPQELIYWMDDGEGQVYTNIGNDGQTLKEGRWIDVEYVEDD